MSGVSVVLLLMTVYLIKLMGSLLGVSLGETGSSLDPLVHHRSALQPLLRHGVVAAVVLDQALGLV